jgi:hypothetical protein
MPAIALDDAFAPEPVGDTPDVDVDVAADVAVDVAGAAPPDDEFALVLDEQPVSRNIEPPNAAIRLRRLGLSAEGTAGTRFTAESFRRRGAAASAADGATAALWLNLHLRSRPATRGAGNAVWPTDSPLETCRLGRSSEDAVTRTDGKGGRAMRDEEQMDEQQRRPQIDGRIPGRDQGSGQEHVSELEQGSGRDQGPPRSRGRESTAYQATIIGLRVVAAAGLAVDAYVHTDLASRFDTGGTISESTLFLLQASLAAAAALGLVVRGRRLEAAFGFLVAAAALGAVLLYRYVDVGKLGPLPDMYDPAWYTEKTLSVIAEAVAVVACAALFALRMRAHRRRARRRHGRAKDH